MRDQKLKFDEDASLLSESEKRRRAQQMQMKLAEFRQSVQMNEQELIEYRIKLVTGLINDLKPVMGRVAQEKSSLEWDV